MTHAPSRHMRCPTTVVALVRGEMQGAGIRAVRRKNALAAFVMSNTGRSGKVYPPNPRNQVL